MTIAPLASRTAEQTRSGALDQRFALDVQGVDALRRTVRNSPQEGLQQVSRQFEAMLLNMVIKTMREAVPNSGLFDSQSQRLYTSMLDQQMSQSLSGRGIGLAEAMLGQLQGQLGTSGSPNPLSQRDAGAPAFPPPLPASQQAALPHSGDEPGSTPLSRLRRVDLSAYRINVAEREELSSAMAVAASPHEHVRDFVQRMGPSAKQASEATGVPALLILAQAALESGWGKREIRSEDGASSHNLFGIKADKSWRGPSVEIWTTEYVDGERQRVRANFRAYGSHEEAFTDYANFLKRNPRYANVLATGDASAAAHGLQRAGYATDPNYGNKLIQIMRQLG